MFIKNGFCDIIFPANKYFDRVIYFVYNSRSRKSGKGIYGNAS